MEISSTKRRESRRQQGPAKLRKNKNSHDYNDALSEAKKMKKEKDARNEEITKLLQEEKERNTVYR